jgi:hypothetical protein
MYEYFAQTPWMLVLTSGFVACVMIAFWVQSRHRICLYLAIVGILLTLIPLMVASMLTSPNERVATIVREMCDCVRHNDTNRLLNFVESDENGIRRRIERELPGYRFSACNVAGGLRVEEDPGQPDYRLVGFGVYVMVDAPSYNHNGPAMRNVKLGFRRQPDDSWKVYSFSHGPYGL